MGGDNDLAAIRARVVAATPGPWYVGEPLDRAPTVRGNRRGASCLYVCETRTAYDSLTVGLVEQKSSEADAELIAHAPTDLLALCAEVERLRAEVAAAERRVAAARPASEWHEDYGPCLWWKHYLGEPPYVGSPLDCDWAEQNDPDEPFTHFTRIPNPVFPEDP